MRYDTIHETKIADIAAIIKGGLNVVKDTMPTNHTGVAYSSSLTKATKGLIMEFPVLISKANHIESAGIVAKAYEAKFVTLLHMAFVASNITNSKEGLEFIQNFHTNLDSGKLSGKPGTSGIGAKNAMTSKCCLGIFISFSAINGSSVAE